MNDRSNSIGIPAGGTCEWLLKHREWKSWLSCDRGLLWIKGNPGSGKSTLLRYALHHLKGTKAGAKDLILSFFFHGRGDMLQRDPLGLFRSLLHQVLTQVPDALAQLVATFEQRRDGIGEVGEKWEWEVDELRKSFEWSILEVLESRQVWLFVDALDECGEENAKILIRHFKSLLQGPSAARSKVHICFTCRHYPVQYGHGGFEVCVERENSQDILTYVHAQLSEFEGRTTFPLPDLITKHANGLFIWARLVVDQILDLELGQDLTKVDDKIKETIDSVPRDLDELYLGIVHSMEKSPASLRLMQWIFCSQRALSLGELRWAMLVEADCPYKSLRECQSMAGYKELEDNDALERRVKVLSRGLVETVPSSNTRIVQFIHQSVKDFFDDKGLLALGNTHACRDGNTQGRPGSATGLAHYQLSRTCIRYLAMEDVTSQVQSSTRADRDRLLSDFPLLDYATRSWIAHVRASEMNKICQKDLLYHFGWPSEHVVRHWARTFRILAPFSLDAPPDGVRLAHIVSRYHLATPLQMIMERKDQAEIDARDAYRRTPLLYAAERGHEAVVKDLLETGKVNVNAQDSLGASPLHWAAVRGHTAIMSLLLENGADIEARDRGGCTPLAWAIQSGLESSVEVLLEHDLALNYEYTLPHAAQFLPYGGFTVVFCGVGSRMTPDRRRLRTFWMPDEKEESHWVCRVMDHPSLGSRAKAILLGVVSGGQEDWNPPVMGSGSGNGYHSLRGVRSTYGDRTPLLRAVELGKHSLVLMLLGKGAMPDFQGSHGWSPLSLAKDKGDETLVKLLEAHHTSPAA